MPSTVDINRRRLLASLSATAASLPLLSLPGFVRATDQTPKNGKILILIELAGGNDGLNTVVPTLDPRYPALRPEIGLPATKTLTLTDEIGLHPAMSGLAELWQRGELRIIEGVGYPNPNRSHFRSIEIWHAGRGAASSAEQGWVSSAFAQQWPDFAQDAWGLSLDRAMGPLAGEGRFSTLTDEDMMRQAIALMRQGEAHPVRPQQATPLEHILQSYDSAGVTGSTILRKLEASERHIWNLGLGDLGQQLTMALRLLEAGVEVPVLKVSHAGYDTHDAQPTAHAALLAELSDAISGFARAAHQIGRWQDVTLVTYSEFGRTAHENGSGGTDHGTAAPVFVVGGAVAGGLAGRRPSLEKLVDDDVVYTTDYRTLYHAILRDLWDIDAPNFAIDGAAPLRLLT